MINIHTKFHNKGKDGRSSEIESFIRKSMDFAISHLDIPLCDARVLDLGADYGYALEYLRQQGATTSYLTGYEPFNTDNPFGLQLRQASMTEDYFFYEPLDLIIFNHTLEHVREPYKAMDLAKANLDENGLIFVAVPEANAPWALWEGHYTLWTKNFLIHFMDMFDLEPVETRHNCFRGDNIEVWGIFKRKK